MEGNCDNKVYLGIDVHKKTYALTAIRDGMVLKKDVLPASPASLVSYCRGFVA